MIPSETDQVQGCLDAEAVLSTLSPDGPIAASFTGFESRKEQHLMMRNVLDAYNLEHIALIEAGTGTGKSLAYLIPAMLWAVETNRRTVISTNTITLQEQLLHKDIPFIEKSLKLDIKTVLVKGMQNYLCLRKMEEVAHDFLLFSKEENEELQKIEKWNENTKDGSRSSLPFSLSHAVWDKVCADSDTCNRNACPYFQKCHFFKARRQAEEAQILVVNHHLLFADLVCRETSAVAKNQTGILPDYHAVILDEAHHIEDIATEYFASRINQLSLLKLLNALSTEKTRTTPGKLAFIKQKIHEHFAHASMEISSLHNRLLIDIPGMRRDLTSRIHEAFGAYLHFLQAMQPVNAKIEGVSGEDKLRILPDHYLHSCWKEQVIPNTLELSSALLRFTQGITALLKDIKNQKNTKLDEQIKNAVFEIQNLVLKLENAEKAIFQFVNEVVSIDKVRWIELQTLKTTINTTLVDTKLDIADLLGTHLFKKFPTIILCSATLTTDHHFQYIRSRLGLTSSHLQTREIKEYCYDSPFNFSTQAMLVLPTDLPGPSDPGFIQAASHSIWEALLGSRGNAFILFTSYKMLEECFELLKDRLREKKYPALKQGSENRQMLLHQFKTTDHSVLFGTDSFWEGVDVVGDALRCVIIVKLPFKVPSEPLFQARSEAITERGGNAFMEYSLPQAIVKFKQGFGRLIRNKTDRGCIVCLDNRVTKKQYGQLFLNSLPACQKNFVPGSLIRQQMSDFYHRTQNLLNETRKR